jgi:hypothetical protein
MADGHPDELDWTLHALSRKAADGSWVCQRVSAENKYTLD